MQRHRQRTKKEANTNIKELIGQLKKEMIEAVK
jgi:hypothetical protein